MPDPDHLRGARIRSELLALVQIPSITGTPEEHQIAQYLHTRCQGFPYFQENPAQLTLLSTELPGSPAPAYAVFALVKANQPTRKTILLISHFDVVNVNNYGGLKHLAFDPEQLHSALGAAALPPAAQKDWESGEYLFGRGVMDMKLGLAVELELLEAFSENRDLYDVNLAFLTVSDEENNNAGMRMAVPFLAEACTRFNLDLVCAINMEPSDAGCPGTAEQMVFLGSMGKLLPFFYVVGANAHVGNYYHGISAALVASKLVTQIEANPALVDTNFGETTAPPICLGQELRRREYSVTIPDRSAVYFNYFSVGKAPSQILREMKAMGEAAVRAAQIHLSKSFSEVQASGYIGSAVPTTHIPVMTYDTLYARIKADRGDDLDQKMMQFTQSLPENIDGREKGLRLVEKLLEYRRENGPIIITGLLPPVLPPRSSMGDTDKEIALRNAAAHLQAYALQAHQTELREAVFFAGISDLSYIGCDLTEEEIGTLARNLPGWDQVFFFPAQASKALDVPVINIGPRGRDAHKMTERLETHYAFHVLPDLIRYFIKQF